MLPSPQIINMKTIFMTKAILWTGMDVFLGHLFGEMREHATGQTHMFFVLRKLENREGPLHNSPSSLPRQLWVTHSGSQSFSEHSPAKGSQAGGSRVWSLVLRQPPRAVY